MLSWIRNLNGNPRIAFLQVIIFTLVSLLVFIERSGVLNHKQRKVHENEEHLHKRILYYFWPEKRLQDKIQARELVWKNIVNGTGKQQREKRFPDVVVVGAERCGAEGITKLLQLHPLVKVSSPLDTRYFTTNYAKGPLYYKESMPWASDNELVLESSPTYFSWPPMSVPKRMKSVMPNAKIIIVLCDPVDRTFADFNEELKGHRLPKTSIYQIFLGTYLRKFSNEKLAKYSEWDSKIQSILFDSFTADYASHVITTGMYYHHAVRWKTEFDVRQLMFIDRDDMLKKTGETVENLQKFLQLPVLLLKEDFVEDKDNHQFCFEPSRSLLPQVKRCPLRDESHQVKQQPKACAETLRKFYAPFNAKLYRYLKRNFEW